MNYNDKNLRPIIFISLLLMTAKQYIMSPCKLIMGMIQVSRRNVTGKHYNFRNGKMKTLLEWR